MKNEKQLQIKMNEKKTGDYDDVKKNFARWEN